ncbi:MAG TPA: hypothetical protein VHB45_14665 [Alloacidobacterium sp.]|nr:hypothetical protein [Alloacidobacterium sp.]
MSTFSHSLPSAHGKRLSLVSRTEPPLNTIAHDDGLGCMRGLAFAMLFNLVFWGVIFGAWEIWHHLR